MAKERDVVAEATDAEGTLVGVDLMNILSPMGQRGKGLYGDVKSPPRPGTREPQMSEDEFIVMLRRKLGPNFNSAMGIPVHQWGGEWKKSSTDMKARIRAVQEVFQDMQRLRMTTVQDDDGGDIIL